MTRRQKRTRTRSAASAHKQAMHATPYPSGHRDDTHNIRGFDPLQVIPEREAADVLNLSVDTLRRRVRDGTGPIRIALSERRIGYRRGDLAAWLDQRASARPKAV